MIKTAKKWIYKIRYILIILSALLGIMGLSSSFGYELINNCYIFTSAGDYNSCLVLSPGEELYTNGFYNSVNSLINFNDGSGNLIWTYNNYNSNYNSSWFWNNGELYFVQNSVPNWSYFRLWKNNYFCQINSLDNTSIMNSCGVINFQGNDNYNWDNYNSSLDTILENFNGNSVSEVLFSYYPSNLGNDVNNTLCFKYNSLGSTFCIHSPGYVNETYGLSGNWFTLIENNGISDGTSTISKYGSLLELSPFNSSGGGGNIGDIITDTGSITNFEAILGYNYTYGFNESYCYGGYPLSDIFYSTDNPENFTGFELGSGAYIYDIYNAYSGSYFTSASQFYQSFYSRYLINNIASFYDYPKALYGIIERYAWLYDHYQTYDPNIGISKLVSYCELYKLDPDSLYDGGDISAENGYSNLIGEITDKWRYYDSGPLSILSGDNIKFGSDEFFTNLLNKINNSIGDITNNAVGVIPRYILVVLAALILFRIISH